MNPPLDWSELKRRREEVRRLYPSIRRVPLVRATKRELMMEVVGGLSGSVLDVGGSAGFLGEICRASPSITEYRLLEVDPRVSRDYARIEEVDRTFDALFLLDVIEHLDLAEGARLLEGCAAVLAPGGTMVLTMPNNLHPTAFGGDVTHVTSYRYHELGALLLMKGLGEIEIARVSAKKRRAQRLLAAALAPVMRFLDMDFATGILIRARRPG